MKDSNNETRNPRTLSKLIRAFSVLSGLEMPVAALAIAAIIPGFLDEILIAIGAVTFALSLRILRQYLIKNRTSIERRIKDAERENQMSSVESQEALKALNQVTIAGGGNGNV